MSFGFGVGDFIAVAELAWKLYHYCYVVSRGAPQEFRLLLQEITALSQSIQLLQLEAKNPTSTLMSSGEDRIRMVGEIMIRVEETLRELEKYAKKYEGLGITKRAKRKLLWDKLKWSSEAASLDSLRNKLVYHNGIINLLLTSCANSSLERIESSNRILERRFSQIGDFIQKIEARGSEQSPTISTIRVGDQAFKAPILSAALMIQAEVGQRRWSSIGVDEWIQAGRWWLLKSQSALDIESPSQPGQAISSQGYADLIKASWILLDVIARHPQLNLLDSSIRLDAEQLAEAIRSEFGNIDISKALPPSSEQIQACDLSIWEMKAKGASIQPMKGKEGGSRSWETQDEQILFQRFGLYQANEFGTSTPCVILWVAHKRARVVEIILRDQSWITLATFKVKTSRPHPVNNFVHIGSQKIEFSTPRDSMHMCAITDAVEEYIYHCDRNGNEHETLRALLLLFAIKNGYTEVVGRLLRDQASAGLESEPSFSTAHPPTSLWRVARELAKIPISTDANDKGGPEYRRNGCNRSLFMWVIQQGHRTAGSRLLALKGIIVSEQDINVWGSLREASTSGMSDVVTFILSENGVKLDAVGHMAFNLAACNGHNTLVKELVSRGVTDDGRRYGGYTTLQKVVERGYELVIGSVIAAGADVNALGVVGIGTALQIAAGKGHEAVVESLLVAGADVNASSTYPIGTALQAAANHGHVAVIERLLIAGADVNSPGTDSIGTALQAAANHGHRAVVERLLIAGADVNAPNTYLIGTALQAAANHGHGAVVERLLIAGADVNAPGTYPIGTALQTAASHGHVAVIERLLIAGADVNAPGTNSIGTALQAAVNHGHGAVVERLLIAGADVNAPGTHPIGTALQAAANHGHGAVVERLLIAGADVNAPGTHPIGTALQAAANHGHGAVVERLLIAGADVNAPGTHPIGTALQAAVDHGHVALVARLLKAGAI
ncbi:hypothetical protein Q9L58_006992 [Maublancomyces gigas]|uniref:Ankyrin repeat protein n=1 Tax=Discina gigas TaxID=1032678 RepID=A0ABR3GE34_9PEZI